MFCLRSWLPALLFFPLHASPYFVVSFFVLTFLLQRPCLYCSALLIVLFCSSCSWASSCFFDFDGNWFEPRLFPSPLPSSIAVSRNASDSYHACQGNSTQGIGGDVSFIVAALKDAAPPLVKAAAAALKRKLQSKPDWGFACMMWLRNLRAGGFRLPCINVQVRL